ncbi:hypothetical protein PGTUg99_011547 [Puccinia graminis f. sp. tritici]|uniref:RRM domain-containing protein n=1 Tax=Puccinia graminis f. sp. tritici TaxID=56615 RepID=A0A5B0SGW4_PUCGR|nr:hypothetical protein PGTUg99_011547 [Puccinia graminis f. sp. tritici]
MKQEDNTLGLGEEDLLLPIREFSFISQDTIDRLNASKERWNQFVEAFRADTRRLHQEFKRRQRRRCNRNKLFYLIHWEPEYRPPPSTTAADLCTALAPHGDITHSFLLVSKSANLGAIVHFSNHGTAAAAAADLDGTCADGFILQARLMSHKEQLPSTLFG